MSSHNTSGNTWPTMTTTAISNTSSFNQYIIDPSMASGSVTNWCYQHITSDENIEYLDGKVFSYCVNCQARIEIGRVPGGVKAIHARELAERLIVASHEGGLEGEEIAELSELVHSIKEEMETLDSILALLRTAEMLLDE